VSLDAFARSRLPQPQIAGSLRQIPDQTFDFSALRERLLDPLSARERRVSLSGDGSREVSSKDIDVLLLDGPYLVDFGLATFWDVLVRVETSIPVAVDRASSRPENLARFGSVEAARAAYRLRYLPPQNEYLERYPSSVFGDVVLQNDVLDCPILELRERRRP